MQVPTGGIAHEPQGMIRCDSEADSIVWMKEDSNYSSMIALSERSEMHCHFRVFFRQKSIYAFIFRALTFSFRALFFWRYSTMNDEIYMRAALELARKGMGHVSPNPMVGALIVRNDQIIGQGYHEHYGGLHAERNALASCIASPEGADLYVTLEPCCHWGKTPPCTDAIIQSGIRRVIIGSSDPNPLVAGQGIKILKEHGIKVTEGVLENECRRLNAPFFHYITTGLPFVTLKYAMTADGKIASFSGRSRWITGETARRHVHRERWKHTAIMTGSGTILADDPLLTCRLEGGRNPVRIICDTHLRTPLTARIIKTVSEAPVILATCCTDPEVYSPYEKKGCTVLTVREKNGHLDLNDLIRRLGQMKIDSILLEGGARLNASALESGIVSRVLVYIAPKIMGGCTAPGPVGGQGVDSPDQAYRLSDPEITRLGPDILLESEVITCSQESLKKSEL